MKIQNAVIGIAILFTFTACATVVGEKTHSMSIKSEPKQAQLTIIDEGGKRVFSGITPTTVILEKSSGEYFGKKEYTIHISKEGYGDKTVQITSRANGWYLAGNLVFANLIGWFVIDPFNGGMYTLSPEAIATKMDENKEAGNSYEKGTLTVVLLEDVPDAMRSKLKRLN